MRWQDATAHDDGVVYSHPFEDIGKLIARVPL